MRILIVEDDYVSRLLLKRHLAKYGDCEMAIDGVEALDIILKAHQENKPFRLICLDIMLPKSNGFSVLKALHEFEKKNKITLDAQAKVIMTTALNDLHTINKAYASGCKGFIWKPIEVTLLNQLLYKLGFEAINT